MKKTPILFIILLLGVVSISSFKAKEIEVLSTSLKITVIDGMGNFVEGATVTIYGNEEDFKNSENPVQEPMVSNEKGVVTFKKIEAKSYFVDVTKDKMTNYGAAQQTPELTEGKVNKVNIVID